MSSNTRNRDSIADLEEKLDDLFTTHHASRQTVSGEPAVPASALVDLIRVFGENHEGTQLLSEEEEENLKILVTHTPDIEITPTLLLDILRTLKKRNASTSHEEQSDEQEVAELVGGEEEDNSGPSSRSSSRSRGPPPPPKTPNSARLPESPFDSSRRKRTAPLAHAAPSSWNSKRGATTSTRRRSDAGSYGRGGSDSESASRPSSRSSNRTSRRSRAPSNPVSPRTSDAELWDSPVRSASRANSRGHYGRSISASLDGMASPNDRPRFDYDRDNSFGRSQHDSDSEEDDDEDDPTLGLVLARNGSMASLESLEREEALQRTNQELQRRVAEQDRILQNRISEHEADLEQMEITLEETKSELSSSKRDEKELRAKETKYIHQIQALESEIAKSQRALENAKASYQSLQKQYQEQCTESESLRNTLRTRDQQYRDAVEKISLHGLEIEKWQQQQEQMEQLMQSLESQLTAAREAQAQLEEQKQENLLLKETIDRLRFDMDELRTKADGSVVSEGKGRKSQPNSISKSLGVELARINSGKWPGGEDTDEEAESTAVSEDASSSEDTEGEDVVQTIITRRKKKVASKAMKRMETIQYEDVKTYSDAYTQHEISEFTTSSTTQTDPEPKRHMAVFSTQTESTPSTSSAIQTDPIPEPLPVVKLEMETQTDAPVSEHSDTVVADESTASSSKLPGRDLPPSYAETSINEMEQEQRDMYVAAEAIRKWHKGLEVPLSPVPRGVSDEALEEWAALKEEMGFDCLAIDKVLEMSLKTGRSRDGTRSERSTRTGATDASSTSRRSRFYNIYNTFVYGQQDADRDRDRDRSLAAGLTQAAVVLGVCVVAAGVLSGPVMQQQYHVPGGPTYYDRAAWSEFNRLYPVGEGLVPDGAATVWDFIGRIGGEAARMARGWPT